MQKHSIAKWKSAEYTEVKSGAKWQPSGLGLGGRWEGASRGRGHVYTYVWFTLIYGRNEHDNVKQLSSN